MRMVVVMSSMVLVAGVLTGCGSLATTTNVPLVQASTKTHTNNNVQVSSGIHQSNPFVQADGTWVLAAQKLLAPVIVGWGQFASVEASWKNGDPNANPFIPLSGLKLTVGSAVNDLPSSPSNATQTAYNDVEDVLHRMVAGD